MGARTNFELQDGIGSIWLYSHSGGDDKSIDFAKALEHARPRWGDTPYAIRMVVSHLIQDRLLDDTGYGLTSYEAGEENYDPLTANFETKVVYYEQEFFTFDDFVKKF
jgi:hypothetical protein